MQDFERDMIRRLGMAVPAEEEEIIRPKVEYVPCEPTPTKTTNDMKKCTKCGELKSRDQFYTAKMSADGLMTCCKDCKNAAVKANKNRMRTAAPSRMCESMLTEDVSSAPTMRQIAASMDAFTDKQLAMELRARGWKIIASKQLEL